MIEAGVDRKFAVDGDHSVNAGALVMSLFLQIASLSATLGLSSHVGSAIRDRRP